MVTVTELDVGGLSGLGATTWQSSCVSQITSFLAGQGKLGFRKLSSTLDVIFVTWTGERYTTARAMGRLDWAY